MNDAAFGEHVARPLDGRGARLDLDFRFLYRKPLAYSR